MDLAATGTRAIGRSAIREELARVAFGRFCSTGFEAVTLDDLAAAAGVSRSTFLRYFGSKEEVVLFVFDPLGEEMVEALGSRPDDEEDWVALRRALDPADAFFVREPAEGLAVLRLVEQTPALRTRLRDKQAGWRPGLAQKLAERPGSRHLSSLAVRARVAAALDCWTAAVEHWVTIEGREGLGGLVDEAFGALLPMAPTSGAPRPR